MLILKRVMVNDEVVFQLQFSWESCLHHTRTASIDGRPRGETPSNRRHIAKPGASSARGFTAGEDECLGKLKKQNLPWKEIHAQFTASFPQRQRSLRPLQARWSNKRKGRVGAALRAARPEDGRAAGEEVGRGSRAAIQAIKRKPAAGSEANDGLPAPDYVINGQAF